jgi:stress response protein SCP2
MSKGANSTNAGDGDEKSVKVDLTKVRTNNLFV